MSPGSWEVLSGCGTRGTAYLPFTAVHAGAGELGWGLHRPPARLPAPLPALTGRATPPRLSWFPGPGFSLLKTGSDTALPTPWGDSKAQMRQGVTKSFLSGDVFFSWSVFL